MNHSRINNLRVGVIILFCILAVRMQSHGDSAVVFPPNSKAILALLDRAAAPTPTAAREAARAQLFGKPDNLKTLIEFCDTLCIVYGIENEVAAKEMNQRVKSPSFLDMHGERIKSMEAENRKMMLSQFGYSSSLIEFISFKYRIIAIDHEECVELCGRMLYFGFFVKTRGKIMRV